MSSIQSSGLPLVFRVGNRDALSVSLDKAGVGDGALSVRVYARALEGMQKEALVAYGATGAVWRMVSDEGPYLDGTDLAPFPLAFFTAGLAASLMSELTAILRQRGIDPVGLELVQDNYYTMTGSAVQGTMSGGALPVDIQVRGLANTGADELRALVMEAVAASPACGLLRQALANIFTLMVNGEPVPTGRVTQASNTSTLPVATDDVFTQVAPGEFDTASDIIRKLDAAATVFGVDGGASTSLAATQNRTLHVSGICRLREDGLKEIRTQLLKPTGSVFRFLSDDSSRFGGAERAPCGLAYLAAGIAFCYLTQFGRYAHIVKKELQDYRIVQDNHFSAPGISGNTARSGAAQPVTTAVFLDTEHGEDFARQVVDMGEQTCFLHAACRQQVAVRLHASSSAGLAN